MIYIISHKCPDTDSLVASIVYQKFLSKLWKESKAIRLDAINNETKFILDKLWVWLPELTRELPEWSKIALMDHNEESQSIDNISKYEIIAVIDHHKIWWFKTSWVPHVIIKPLWSTNSILAQSFQANWIEIDKLTAQLIISAIISDTMWFRAPTTTKYDREIVEELNKIAWFADLESYAMDMFKAKSDLWDISSDEILKVDYKEYQFWDKKVWLAVLETTNPWYALWRKDEILIAMNKMKNNGYNFVSLSIVDILNQTNLTIVPSEHESWIYEKTLWWKTEDSICDLWNKVSRKLDIIPVLTKYFSE